MPLSHFRLLYVGTFIKNGSLIAVFLIKMFVYENNLLILHRVSSTLRVGVRFNDSI